MKDLTAGSGFTFEDAGDHELKGVPDRGASTALWVERRSVRGRLGSREEFEMSGGT